MPMISFMLANYVARPLGYHMTEGWSQGEQATSAYFKPIGTFAPRFEQYLKDVQAMGYEAVDLWQPMLDHRWLTDEHLETAVELLEQYGMPVVSFAGGFGSTPEQLVANCEICAALNIPVMGGGTRLATTDHGFMVDMLRKYDLKWGYENHPEKSPEEILEKIGAEDEDVVGVCADTGWFGTYGYDAAEALRRLAPRLFHVHLKDVLAAGSHETCRYGAGVVPIRECVQVLQAVGYEGAITVEHEPEWFDPTEDCIENLRLLSEWLG